MTEFEKYWADNRHRLPADLDMSIAEKIWDTAQRAAIRVLQQPPYIPKLGEKVKICSLVHPRFKNSKMEVVGIEKKTIICYDMSFRLDNGDVTGGFLGEVEKVE